MDALELIKQHLDVEQVLEHYKFEKLRPHGNYYRACCKIHEGNNPSAFVIHHDTGLWSCHTGDCGSGDIFHLVQKLESISFPNAVHRLAQILRLDINDLEIVARTKQERKELREFLQVIKRMSKEVFGEYHAEGDAKMVEKFKEFDLSTIKHFGLVFFETFYGTNSNDKPITLHNMYGFPIHQNGVVIGYSLRATDENSEIKWMHQPTHIKTGDILYNYENAIGKTKVVVVEGITDVWAYHEIGITAVATYGARITEEQHRLLLQLGADLVFSFDGDEAGRHTMKKAYELFSKTTNIQFVHLPEDKDPENISREDLTKHYEQKNNNHLPKDA